MAREHHIDFDVFISYSSNEKAWVRGELLKRIEKAGLKAFIDFRDFTRGAPSLKEMARGVQKCRKTLVILTPGYIESEWCELEVVMAQTLSPANRDLRLIPLLKSACEKPLFVGALTHIDFTDGADLDLAWRQLLIALGKPPEPEPPKELVRDEWFLAHPYPMPPNFTGRHAERAMLNHWLGNDHAHPVLVLRALGGFGKSALVWHWLTHDVPPAAWPRVVWWSFYEGDASFAHFLVETLDYLSGRKTDSTKCSAKDAVRALMQMLLHPGTLLVLDGFERALRAFSGLHAAYQGDAPTETRDTAHSSGITHYASRDNDRDCVSPLAELFLYNVALQPRLRSKALLTTRLIPRVLEAKGGGFLHGCREEELRQMQAGDAVEFYRAQGIRGTHTEIEAMCQPYGYHPLSLRLLAGLIVGDFQQPGDIATAKRLDVSGDLVQCQHHVLETAYDSLTPERRALLGQIACFRSPVKYEALKALAATITRQRKEAQTSLPSDQGSQRLLTSAATEKELDADLRDLVARGLLHHDTKERRFDLHPIVRRYAYDRLAAPDRAAAHTRLRDYFAAVPEPDKVTHLEDLTPVIELYHHTVRAGQFDDAFALYNDRLDPLYYQLGAYQLIIDLLRALFPDGEDRPPRLYDEMAQAVTLTNLANAYGLSGQPSAATPLMKMQIAIVESLQDYHNVAVGLANLAILAQIPSGSLRAAESSLKRVAELGHTHCEAFDEGGGHADLGRLFAYRGFWTESEAELTAAQELLKDQVQYLGATWAYLALRGLLQARCTPQGETHNDLPAIAHARRALELADETARTIHVFEFDYVRAHWLLGAANRMAGQFDEAERYLHEALERCRRTNAVWFEADILVDMARLRAATGTPDEARRLAEEALFITERSGYVLQGADAHLELAKLALARGNRPTALTHAQEAHHLATCDGPPDYTYKAAYEEANMLLRQLGG